MTGDAQEKPIGRLTEQYDLTLTKREMDELMLSFRMYVRAFEVTASAESMLDRLEELYEGGGSGLGVEFRAGSKTLATDDPGESGS